MELLTEYQRCRFSTTSPSPEYLAWAFSEAAEFARRYDEQARSSYTRKMRKTNFMVAHRGLAHKLSRAAYYLMKDQVPFMPDKLFS
jgi:transposase